MNDVATAFTATPAIRAEEPLLLGMVGPPGGGKTLSSLRLAKGIQSVRGGPIVLIDTEGGRSRKYADQIPFDIVEFSAPCRSERFLEAIRAQIERNPAAIIVDSLSDEHEGEGGYLEWHDEMIPKMGGNEWAAWSKPKASRKRLINGILHIKTPLIFTFRAREKTKQDGKKVVNIGWQPVAPLEIVHTLDLTCILPPRADGVPVWKSEKIGEDFIIKLPSYLKPFIEEGKPLSEDMGRGFALWAKGGAAPVATYSPEELLALARELAAEGAAKFNPWYKKLSGDDRERLAPYKNELRERMEAAAKPLEHEIAAETNGPVASSPAPTAGGEASGGGDGTASASPVSPQADASPAIAPEMVKRLADYSEALTKAMSKAGLQKKSGEFWDGDVPDEATPVGRLVKQIFDLHVDRIANNGSTVEVERKVREMLA